MNLGIFPLIFILLLCMTGGSSSNIKMKHLYLDYHDNNTDIQFLDLNINVVFDDNSVNTIEIDVTSFFDEKTGILAQYQYESPTPSCSIFPQSNKIYIKSSGDFNPNNPLQCTFPVVISQILKMDTIFKYYVTINGGDSAVLPQEYTVNYKKLLLNPETMNYFSLLPEIKLTNTLLFPDSDSVDNKLGFQGVFNSVISIKEENIFVKNAKITPTFHLSVPDLNIHSCQLFKDGVSINTFYQNLNKPFSVDMTVTNEYSFKCIVSTFMPIILGGPETFTGMVKLTFPSIIILTSGDVMDEMDIIQYIGLPSAKIGSVNVPDQPNRICYDIEVNFHLLIRPLFLRNIINYYTKPKSNVIFEVLENSLFESAITLTDDNLSLKIDVSNNEPQYQSGSVKIRVYYDDYDKFIITPFLSSTNSIENVHKYIIDFIPIYQTIIITPTIKYNIIHVPDNGLFAVVNLNIAHYVYNINFPEYISVKLDNNEYNGGNLANYHIRLANVEEVQFSDDNNIDPEQGVNYILTIHNQQTVRSYPYPNTGTISGDLFTDSNYVFIPITINVDPKFKPSNMIPFNLSFRNPLTHSTPPFYTNTFSSSISDLPSDFQNTTSLSDDIKQGDTFIIDANIYYHCDLRSVKHNVVIQSDKHFHVNYCEVEEQRYTYDSSLSYDENTGNTNFSFTTGSTEPTSCSSSSERRYDLVVKCSMYRTHNSDLLKVKQIDIKVTMTSPLIPGNDGITRSVKVNLSPDKPTYNTVDDDRSYISMIYSKVSLQSTMKELIHKQKFISTNIGNNIISTGAGIITDDISNNNPLTTITTHIRPHHTDFIMNAPDKYLGYFKIVFTGVGEYYLRGFENTVLYFNMDFVNDKSDSDFTLCEADISNNIIKIKKNGICHFSYLIKAEIDDKPVSLDYIEKIRIPQTNPNSEDLYENEYHTVWKRTTLSLNNVKPSLTLNVINTGDFEQYRIRFNYRSEMMLVKENYQLKFHFQNMKVSELSYDIDTGSSCPQFTDSSDLDSNEVQLTMEQSKNVENDSNTCDIYITPKTYPIKTQLVSFKVVSPNINIEDYNNIENAVFNLKVKVPIVKYDLHKANLEMDVNLVKINPEAAPIKYYVLFTDNFNSKPKKCTYETQKHSNYYFIGPITQNVDSTSININCDFDINIKHINPVNSYAYIMFDGDFARFKRHILADSLTEASFKQLVLQETQFNIPVNKVSTVSSVVPVLSWTHKGKDSINKQIDDAKQLIADSAKTTKDKVFVIELTYSNSTQTAPYFILSDFYTLSTGGSVQAKFGIQGNQFNQQDLENALNNAVGNNPNLNDLSTSVIIDDIIQQCLAADLGCGALCAPCTGNESCLSDFDCLSGICSFGKCSKLDDQGNGNGNSVVKLSTTAIFLLSIIFTVFYL